MTTVQAMTEIKFGVTKM